MKITENMKTYIALGYDFITKKKIELSVTANNINSVRSKISKESPRLVVQAIYPDFELDAEK